jgi:hypothetical protein
MVLPEPVEHLADELSLWKRNFVLVNAARDSPVEGVPLIAGRCAGAGRMSTL